MKVLLDECVERRLAGENGELLARAAHEFDVFVTVDHNLPFQQDLPQFALAVVVLRARSNRIADLRALIPQLLAALPAAKPAAKPGDVTWVGI